MSTSSVLATLFARDFKKLQAQVEAFPSDALLWKSLPGVTNSAGNLILHLEGNSREFVGRLLGEIAYQRDRPLEFSASGLTRAELVRRVGEVAELVPRVVAGLSAEQMAREYPVVVLAAACSTEEFLMHLYGHLNWHLGQIDYLRRILSER